MSNIGKLMLMSWAVGNIFWMRVFKEVAPYQYTKRDGEVCLAR